MLQNFVKSLLRQLWRNRLFTALNIIGLTVCICVAWIIFRMVSYEHSFDKQIAGAQNIYQLVSKSEQSGRTGGFAGVSLPVYPTLKNDVSGVDMVVPMFYKYHNKAVVKNADGAGALFGGGDDDIQLVSTSPDYFKMLGYKWLAGNPEKALDAPDKIVLTDARAKEYFPSLSPGEIMDKIIFFDDSIIRHVSGVVADFDFPNSFSADNQQFIALYQEDLTNNSWGSKSSNNLVFFIPEKNTDPARIMAQLNRIDLEHNREMFAKYKFNSWYDVLPLKNKHFEPQYSAQTRAADKKVLRGLMITGAFLLLLACINYINLSTAMLPGRAREIGIRKTLGSSSRNLVLRFMGETLLVTFLAALLSFALTAFAVKMFAGFFPAGMLDYMNYGGMAIFMLALIGVIVLLSGLYPAYVASKVKTTTVLKGVTETVKGRHRFTFRKGLIVFQFLIAQVFIIGSIIVHQQLNYALNKDPGFNKNGVITIQVPYYVQEDPQYKDKQFVLKSRLQQSSGIAGVSLGSRPMDNTMYGNILTHYRGDEEIQQQINMKFGDTDYLKVYGFKLIAGRNFVASDTMNELVINEQAVKAFGFSSPDHAIGQMLAETSGNKRYPIVGVVSDFHQYGVQSAIDPVLITTSKSSGSSILNIKLPDDISRWKASISLIEKEWKSVYAGVAFNYVFYDETVAKFYSQEEKMQTLVRTATAIAILISCLGLFGLATLTSFQRTKEVGIRKVLGASVSGVAALLSKEFLILVVISIIIASPIAWWLMSNWLQDYAYRINIQWWMFGVAALMACMVALMTVSYQAIKAARANPVNSLRSE